MASFSSLSAFYTFFFSFLFFVFGLFFPTSIWFNGCNIFFCTIFACENVYKITKVERIRKKSSRNAKFVGKLFLYDACLCFVVLSFTKSFAYCHDCMHINNTWFGGGYCAAVACCVRLDAACANRLYFQYSQQIWCSADLPFFMWISIIFVVLGRPETFLWNTH